MRVDSSCSICMHCKSDQKYCDVLRMIIYTDNGWRWRELEGQWITRMAEGEEENYRDGEL